MKKQINATGANGTFTGWVEVELNQETVLTTIESFTKKTKETKQFYHNIIGWIDGKPKHEKVITEHMDIWEPIKTMEDLVMENLRFMADKPPIQSIESQLKAKGFV